MTPFYIKRVNYDQGSWVVTVGDANNEAFEKHFEIDATRLIHGKLLEELMEESTK